MILLQDELSGLISGTVWTEPENGFLRLWRFSPAHIMHMHGNANYLCRAKAAAGMTIDLTTDSHTLSFTLSSEPAAGVPWFGMDIMMNEQLFHHMYHQNGSLTATMQLTLPQGQKRVTIYLPNLCSIAIGNFILADGASWSPVIKSRKLLFLGDSITQGYVTEHPSRSYVHLLNRAMDAECLNQAIGGAVYNAEQLDQDSYYQPDMIFAAYGTNDWNLKQNLSKNVDSWYQKLHCIYGTTPVFVLLPIWRTDYTEKEAAGHEQFLQARNRIKEKCKHYSNCCILDTFDYIEHDRSFFMTMFTPTKRALPITQMPF